MRPGIAFSHMSLSCPPSGIQTPPCGPVMSRMSAAVAGPGARPAAAVTAAAAMSDVVKLRIRFPPVPGFGVSSPLQVLKRQPP